MARLLTVMVSDGDVAEAPVESLTLIVKVKLPSMSGVPAMGTELLVLAPSDNPPGSAPDATDQANGPTPPVALTVWAYAPLTLPDGSELVVMVGWWKLAGVPEQPEY